MIDSPKLSIIIPLFNMESYIERCLRSIFDQDIPEADYEIIVINDGSTDRGSEKVAGLKNKHSNLVLINQSNHGVSVARNQGILIAKGKFILFVDADDYLVVNSLRNNIEKAERELLDVLYLSIEVFDGGHNFLWKNDFSDFKDNIYNGIETYKNTRGKKDKDPDRSCGIMFNRSFLQRNQIMFLEGVPYLEDGLFVGIVLCLAKRCSFEINSFYIRTINPESASNSSLYNTDKARDGFLEAAAFLKRYGLSSPLTKIQQGLINHLTAKFILSAVISGVGSKDIKKLVEISKKIHLLGFEKLITDGLITNKHYVKLYNCSIIIFIIYYVIETRITTFYESFSKIIK